MTSDDFFERIEAHFNKYLPFVVYRKPNQQNINACIQSNDELYFTEDFTEKGFVFSPFDDTEKTVLIPNGISEVISCVPFSDIHSEEVKGFDSHLETNESKQFHINLVQQGVEAIKKTALKKVVLSRQETVILNETNPISIFKKLLGRYKSAFVYCWYHPKVGLWLGATPETLIKIEGTRLSIMALAGTQEYKGRLDVVWKDKEKQEQQFVTDFITNNLKPLVEQCNVSGVETVKAGNLVHLKTMITAKLKAEMPLQYVLKALHPTPAVCGLPKDAAKQFILEHEFYNREFYTGFLGELNCETTLAPRSSKRNIENRAYAVKRNSTQLYVNLRCMQLKNNQAIIYVGGGITESSDAEMEWEETVSKSMVIKSILQFDK